MRRRRAGVFSSVSPLSTLRFLFRLLGFSVPLGAGLLVISLWPERLAHLEVEASARALVDVMTIAAWVLPVLVALSAWHHGRSRLSFAGLSLAALGVTFWRLPSPSSEILGVLPILSLAAGMSFALTALFDERGILTRVGLPRLFVLVGLLGGTVFSLETKPSTLARFLVLLEGVELPVPGAVWLWSLGLSCGVGVMALTFLSRPDRLEVGCSLCLTALSGQLALVVYAGEWGDVGRGLSATVLLLAGSLTLMLALHVLSWRHANVDALTGLPSRRALDERLPKLGGRYCLAVVDIDHFKRVNDRHGHPAGDAVLKAVARSLSRFGAGTVFRSGGEEFTAVCPGWGLEDILGELDDLRETVSRELIPVPSLPGRSAQSTQRVKLTVSIGVASRSGRNASPHRVLAAADEALLRAKKRGRNRVEAERRGRSERSPLRRGSSKGKGHR